MSSDISLFYRFIQENVTLRSIKTSKLQIKYCYFHTKAEKKIKKKRPDKMKNEE